MKGWISFLELFDTNLHKNKVWIIYNYMSGDERLYTYMSVNKFATYTKDMDSKTIYMHNIDEDTYLYNYGYYFVGKKTL